MSKLTFLFTFSLFCLQSYSIKRRFLITMIFFTLCNQFLHFTLINRMRLILIIIYYVISIDHTRIYVCSTAVFFVHTVKRLVVYWTQKFIVFCLAFSAAKMIDLRARALKLQNRRGPPKICPKITQIKTNKF